MCGRVCAFAGVRAEGYHGLRNFPETQIIIVPDIDLQGHCGFFL